MPLETLPPLVTSKEAEPLLGLAALAKLAFAGADLSPIHARLMERATHNPHDGHALLDLSTILQLMGNREIGLALQTQALAIQQSFRVSSSSTTTHPIRLLAIMKPGDLTENNAVEFLVEGTDVELEILYVSADLPLPGTVPEHDVAIVAICESDRNRGLLQQLELGLKAWPRPVLNAPERIARMSRDGTRALLPSQPGLCFPRTVRRDRNALERVGSGESPVRLLLEEGDFPIVVRPIDTHKGQGQAKVDTPAALTEYLQSRSEHEFFVAPFIDYRSPDGQYRKYRVVLIDGRPFLCHLAISSRWMVHYMSAGMVESAEKRAEEARVMADFDHGFALRHHAALDLIARRLDLDYVGLDCGETPAGELLIFEFDSGMTVHSMDPIELFPYKHPQMRKVFNAFHRMLADAIAAKRSSEPL